MKEATWSTAFINDLPDSSFTYIEPGGKKDAGGKTTPRSLRHFPYKDASGKVDLPHLRNALARLSQAKLPAAVLSRIKSKLQSVAKKVLPSYQEAAAQSVYSGDLREALQEATFKDFNTTGIVQNVLFAKRFSRNHRDYKDVLARIAELSEGLNVYLNHPTPTEDEEFFGIRDVRNLAATANSGKQLGEEVRGTLNVAPAYRGFFSWLLEAKPQHVALSLIAPEGEFRIERGSNGNPDRVVELSQLSGIDLVSNAGMGKSLTESESRLWDKEWLGGEREMEINTTKELREQLPALVSEIEEPLKTKITEAEAAQKAAEQDRDELKALSERRDVLIKALIEKKAIRDTDTLALVESLSKVSDDEVRKVLLEKHLGLVEKLAKSVDDGVDNDGKVDDGAQGEEKEKKLTEQVDQIMA